MAVGYERTDDRDAQVWELPDGETWAKSTDPGLLAPGLQELNGVASNGSRVVAVGYSGDLADKDAAAWHRPS